MPRIPLAEMFSPGLRVLAQPIETGLCSPIGLTKGKQGVVMGVDYAQFKKGLPAVIVSLDDAHFMYFPEELEILKEPQSKEQ